SRRSSAYDDWDLQLLTAIANEASIALERANLYERTATLSRRLFELHRVGLAIAERTELVDVTRLLAESVVGLLKPAVCAIYLDKGGDTLDFAFSTGKPASDVLALPKNTPLMARVLESGQPVALAQRDDAPENARKLLERFGHEALLVHPLRSADQTVGVLFVTWREPHLMTDDERELIGILAGVGASTIRLFRGVVPIVRHANERWDGAGYPDGLAGEQIPLTARILAVAIAYESMLADRPYRPARREDQALAEIKGMSGKWYDPTVVNAFVAMIDARGVIHAAEEEVQTTSRELAILSELTPEFHTILDLQQLLDRTLVVLQRAVPGASLTILLHDEQTDELVARAVAGTWTTVESPSRIPTDRGISGWVFTHREGQIVDDVRADPRYIGDPRV